MSDEPDAGAVADVALDAEESLEDVASDASAPESDSTDEPVEDVAEAICWTGIQLCEGDAVKTCVNGQWSEVVPCTSGTCVDGLCVGCTSDCTGLSCGPDGCGGSCGQCAGGAACAGGQCSDCVADCADLECGSDGCGGSCGQCAGGAVCDGGQCQECVVDCADLECGSDGCGGSCGFCDVGLACADGSCSCSPSCAGKECGPDGCGGECGICLGDFACSESNECLPSAYRAVLIQGHWNSGMDCSQYNSTGADIDAIELRGVDGELVSYFIEVIEEVGTDACQNDYTDPGLSVGAPDGDYMALQGGWLMGRFADYVPVTSGMSLVVHEAYSEEAYSIYLATGFDCAESDDPGTCATLITDQGFGSVEVEIP